MRILSVTLFILLPALVSAVPPCDVIAGPLRANGDADLLICGDNLPARIEIETDSADSLKLAYLQPLRRCAAYDARRGFHAVVNTGSATSEVELRVLDAASGTTFCSIDADVQPSRPSPPPAWNNAMPADQAHFIDVGGIATRYFEKGDGPPLVLVHGGQAGGSNNSAAKWEQNIDGLAKSFRVIALDRLAQAGTENLISSEHYAEYFARDAEHLESFINALELKNVTLIGHSQGGWPVTRVALNRPELIKCLVNVDTVMVPDNTELMRESLAFLMYMSRELHPDDGPTFYSARRGMRLRYPSGKNITNAKAQRVIAQYRSEKTRAAREQMAARRMTPLHPSFRTLKTNAHAEIADGRLRVRSLVVWGALDPQVPLGLGEQFNKMLDTGGTETKLVVIVGAGHAPFVEYPNLFNGIIVENCRK